MFTFENFPVVQLIYLFFKSSSRRFLSNLFRDKSTMETPLTFWAIGHKITGHNTNGSLTQGHRKFRAFFGTSPTTCFVVWNMLLARRPRKSTPEHLLWALLLLKQYSIESVNAALVGVSEKTFRKWSYIFIRLLAHIQMVIKRTHYIIIPNFIVITIFHSHYS